MSKLRRWTRSMAIRAIIMLVAVLALVSVATGALFSSLQGERFRGEIDKRGRSLVQMLRAHQDVRFNLATGDSKKTREVLQEVLGADEDVAYLAVLDSSQKLFAAASRAVGDEREVAGQLAKHPLGGEAASDAQLRRFTLAIQDERGGAARAGSDDALAMEIPDAAPAKAGPAGYIVLGLRADRLQRAGAAQAYGTVLVAGVVLLVAFLTYFLYLSRRTGRMVHFAEQLAVGQLGRTLGDQDDDELGRLANALRMLQESTTAMVRQMQQAAAALDSSSADVLHTAESQLQRANRQAAGVSEVGAAISELRTTFEHAQSTAAGVLEQAQRSEESSQAGEAALTASEQAVAALREQVEKMARKVAELVEKAERIGELVEAVDELSEQSHVLSINAAIEAARAGEAGLGFAVVARQVRRLADQSRGSTAQVGEIVASIRESARVSVAEVNESQRRAAEGVEKAKAAGEALRSLGEALRQSSGAAAQIVTSAREQADSVAQIWEAMQDIGQAATDAASGIEQLRRASGGIEQHSAHMLALVRQYQVRQ